MRCNRLSNYFIVGCLIRLMIFIIIFSSNSYFGAISCTGTSFAISIFIMMSVIQEPDSSLAIWSSIFPFTSPIVMPARIPFEPETWQIVLSMISLIGGFIFTSWLAGKIYRVGILMYGKKITMKEIAKWVVRS